MVVSLGPGKFYGSSLPRPRYYTDIKFNSDRVDPPVPVLDSLLSWANEAHWSMGGLNFERHRLQGRIEGNVKKLRAEREKTVKHRKQNALIDLEQRESDEKKNGNSGKRAASLSPPPAPRATKRRRFMALIDEDEDEEEEVAEREESVGVGLRRRSARKLVDDFDRVASENVMMKKNPKSGGLDNGDLGETKRDLLKSKMMRAAENLSSGTNTVAARTRSKVSDDVVEEVVEEDLKVTPTRSKGRKLKKIGERHQSNGVKSLAPASGIRTSPRLLKKLG